MRSAYSAAALLPLVVSLAHAADTVYVTDLAIFTELASCAQYAISTEVMGMTESKCSEGVTALQSCICTEKGYSSSLVGVLSEQVLSNCAKTGSADVSSALTVFDAYCNQASISMYTFPSPSVTVTQLVGDIAEMQYLAPCASSQVSQAVMSMADSLCPTDAAHLATCVCSKNQNSLAVSARINTVVGDACKSQAADISSAQAFYAAYCNLNNGTSSFPSATNPPGDMSYYITDIPAFWSLTGCGQTALSEAIFTQTYNLCPEGPQLLASCACIKPSMSSVVNSYITSLMSWSCSSNQVRDAASSALSIFGMYCSAARDDTTLAGITTSIAQTAPLGIAVSNTAAAPGTATATGTTATGSSSGNTTADTTAAAADDSSHSNKTLIIGAVVGAVGGLVVVGIAAFFVWRHAHKRQAQKHDFQQLDNLAPTISGKPELAGTPISAASGQSGPSPRQDYAELHSASQPTPELQSASRLTHNELDSRAAVAGSPAEMYSTQQAPHPLHPPSPIYEADAAEPPSRSQGTTPASAHELSFNAGPVPQTYSELDGSVPGHR